MVCLTFSSEPWYSNKRLVPKTAPRHVVHAESRHRVYAPTRTICGFRRDWSEGPRMCCGLARVLRRLAEPSPRHGTKEAVTSEPVSRDDRPWHLLLIRH